MFNIIWENNAKELKIMITKTQLQKIIPLFLKYYAGSHT